MKFYHATTPDKWQQIRQEGVLWGKRDAPSRCTYLATELNEARQYGPVLLEVEYEPKSGIDNWCEGCWQCRVYTPISLAAIRQIFTS